MPIVRTYGDVGVFGQGARDAGFALGRSHRLSQQREIDARFIENRLGARERITAMRTQANLMGSQRGGGGSSQRRAPADDGAKSVLDEFRIRKAEREESQAMAKAEQQAALDDRSQLMQGIEDAYEGRQKDMAYYYAKDQVSQGNKLPDRILAALGIENAGEKEAKAKADAEAQMGQVETFEPRTDRERLMRRTLQQGRVSDLSGFLDQTERPSGGMEGALTADAMAARTQLEGFANVTTDKKLLAEYRDELKGKGTSQEVLQTLDDRIEELEREEMEVKAPAAFEQAITSFQTQLQAAQDKEGRSLDVSERRKLLSKTLTTTAKSFGLSIDQIGQYVRQNDENRRMAEELIQRAQDAIIEARPPEGTPTGSETQFGLNDNEPADRGQQGIEPASSRRRTFGGPRGAPQ